MPTVLLIEDEPSLRQLLRLSFSEAGYTVQEAGDGVAGLDRARRSRPDLIVLDVMLPGIDGQEVYRQLQLDELTSSIPILVVTASTSAQDELRWQVGVANTFSKPFDAEAVVQRANVLIGRE